jgi:hypothetical protein
MLTKTETKNKQLILPNYKHLQLTLSNQIQPTAWGSALDSYVRLQHSGSYRSPFSIFSNFAFRPEGEMWVLLLRRINSNNLFFVPGMIYIC